jgi:hypothetical protein
MAPDEESNQGHDERGEVPAELASTRRINNMADRNIRSPLEPGPEGPTEVRVVEPVQVSLQRSRRIATAEILTWRLIQRTAQGLSFNNYLAFMDFVLCNDRSGLARLGLDRDGDIQAKVNEVRGTTPSPGRALVNKRFLPYTDADAYRLLKVATEAFVTVNCGIPLFDFIFGETSFGSPLPSPPDAESDATAEYQKLLVEVESFDPAGANQGTIEDFWREYLIVVNGSESLVLPYLLQIREKLRDQRIKQNIFALEHDFTLPDTEVERCHGILAAKLLNPCMVELIWSYWHEEGMQVQSMNAIGRRFQNVRGPAERDPLALVEIDPLRPLNNILWGYIQDEQHRLSVVRRAYEYNHHYGLTLEGKAVPDMRPADPRGRFLEAFHFLLYQASVFYKQDDDTTVIADGFPVLNALRDLHMVLAEGAHNQFGDLPTTARIEMLMEQWLLARPELREYLPRRIMVAYPEPWMDSVDGMKRLQGWTDSSIMDFNFLAVDGEQILLSVRFTRWSQINDAQLAGIWARLFRNAVQRYIHSYRAVTGVDLTAPIVTPQQRELITTRPSVLLRQRLENRGMAPALPPAAGAPVPARLRERRAERDIAGR